MYTVPAKLRSMENLHILFWLVKDICWCLAYRPLGLAMVVPTLSIAIYITVKNRQIPSELAHNLAISLWIIANSLWMVAEFFLVDDVVKPWCLLPFSLGLLILLYFYLVYIPLQRKKNLTAAVLPDVKPALTDATN